MTRWKFIPCLILLLMTANLVAQTFTVSGYVADGESGETLIGVNVIVRGQNLGAATDGNGYFRITGMARGKHVLLISRIGYARRTVDIEIQNQGIVLEDILLDPEVVEGPGLVVTAKRSEIADVEIDGSHREITPEAIRRIPSSARDVFHAIKFLPGIQGIDPFSPLFAVRGSDPGENLILLDGVTIYNPYHSVTAAGLFNLYAIKNIEMLVGGFGAEYGGRNSSILYLTTREGNNQKLHGEVKPGLSNTNFVLDFPVGERATMMVSGRAYYGLLSRFLFYSPNYFYDMNTSLNWKLNSKNRLSFRYFYSRDYLDIDFNRFFSYIKPTFDIDLFEDYHLNYENRWRNQAATAILKSVISPKIYLKAQVSASMFSSSNLSLIDYTYEDDETGDVSRLFHRTDLRNNIRDLGTKLKLDVLLSPTFSMTTGGEFNQYQFGNDIQLNEVSEGETILDAWLAAGFVESKLKAGPMTLRLGLRMSLFSGDHDWASEPRVNALFRLPGDMKLKAAWGRYNQYVVSINSQDYEMSQFLDYYYPLKDRLPSQSTHYILGLEKPVTANSKLNVDFYYKKIDRTYTFDYNVSELEAFRFTDKIKEGSGISYGAEFMWTGSWRRLTGWLSYGISRSTRSYPHIMDGKTYLFDYDRTHAFKAMVTHQIHPALSYTGTLRVMSGVPKTLETTIKSYYYYDPLANRYTPSASFFSNKKNNVRMPVYIRLDLGVKKRIRRGFGAQLADFLGAKESYVNVNFGNLLFLYRNVSFYFPMEDNKLYGMGTNYMPEFSMGYTVKF